MEAMEVEAGVRGVEGRLLYERETMENGFLDMRGVFSTAQQIIQSVNEWMRKRHGTAANHQFFRAPVA